MLFSVLLFSHLLYGGKGFNYENFLNWDGVCKTGKNQSPIDLRAVKVIEQNDSSPPLYFKNYNATPLQVELKHLEYTVSLQGKWQGNTPEVTGPIVLGQTYILHIICYDWSNDNNNGTEHSINGKKYAAELHIVYYNKKYKDIFEASNHLDGVLEIAVLYYVDDTVAPNPEMKFFATYAKSLRTKGSKITLGQSQFDLSQLLPNLVGSFFSYSGSFVIPPCKESVHWIVMADPRPINTQIINAFRNIILENGSTHNTRPLQATNKRLVEFYKKYTKKDMENYTEKYTEKNGLNFIKYINNNINAIPIINF